MLQALYGQGDRIISARKLAEREQVSLPTALEALRYLEAEGLIIARPRSGYFVRQPAASGNEQRAASLPGPVPVTMSAIARSLFGSAEARLVPLGRRATRSRLASRGCTTAGTAHRRSSA
ncbi:transcriptional regulator [Klebsiella michiganensis]|uniref:Transcriptional regulator n=1 Tax=Klebsiella michiganensis TaxID=1134687 RepID=A0A7H4MZW7_9ENTR|nr:transcriptional regulator [Klebsiella michiganensis]